MYKWARDIDDRLNRIKDSRYEAVIPFVVRMSIIKGRERIEDVSDITRVKTIKKIYLVAIIRAKYLEGYLNLARQLILSGRGIAKL